MQYPSASLQQKNHKETPNPDPPNLTFLEKARVFPKKARVFIFAEPLKSLEMEGKTQEKARKIGKTKKARKSKKARIGGSGKYKNPKKSEEFLRLFSRSASGGCLQGGASFKGGKAHFAA